MMERDGSAKAIVFSQFTSFLDLIQFSLMKVICTSLMHVDFIAMILWCPFEFQSGVSCVQLNGAMSLGARDAAIKKFTEEPECRIFLMSLKAGGVALNLTVASHVNDILLFTVFCKIHQFTVSTVKLNKYEFSIISNMDLSVWHRFS